MSKSATTSLSFDYVDPNTSGFTRRAHGKSFRYLDHKGKSLRSKSHLHRIRSLVIPPAWQNVWICTNPRGHIQVVGIDPKGRKQYLYHKNWLQHRDQLKFQSLIEFSDKLPNLRRSLEKHLNEPELTRNKVLAACVFLLDRKQLRVGNDIYAKENNTYGISTVRKKHIRFVRDGVHFSYRGKKGIHRNTTVFHKKLIRVIKECHKLPGHELFKYKEENKIIDVKSDHINNYIKEITAMDEVSAKTFRTWWGCVHMLQCLSQEFPAEGKTKYKKAIITAYKNTAKHLNNTVAVCKKSYVDPHIPSSFEKQDLWKAILRKRQKQGLSKEESRVYHLLKHCYK